MTPLGATTMTDLPNTPDEEYFPEFRTVRRGYDPEEVERVLDELYTALNDAAREVAEQTAKARSAERVQEELRAALADAQRRIAEIESRPGTGRDSSFETVGSRVSEILGAAAAEAAEITRRAHEKAQILHDEAEATSVTSRAEADHYASDVRERAEREALAITATARTEAERILADARALRQSQQRADTEAYERVAAELADRQAHAEVEFATTSAGLGCGRSSRRYGSGSPESSPAVGSRRGQRRLWSRRPTVQRCPSPSPRPRRAPSPVLNARRRPPRSPRPI